MNEQVVPGTDCNPAVVRIASFCKPACQLLSSDRLDQPLSDCPLV